MDYMKQLQLLIKFSINVMKSVVISSSVWSTGWSHLYGPKSIQQFPTTLHETSPEIVAHSSRDLDQEFYTWRGTAKCLAPLKMKFKVQSSIG